MNAPQMKKTALDRLMQVISLAVILLLLTSTLSSVRSAEQSSPRTSQTRYLQATPSPVSAQQTPRAGQLAPVRAGQAETVAAAGTLHVGQIEPLAGSWPTWVLKSGREVAVPPPPGDMGTAAELEALRDLVARRDVSALPTIQYWDAGSPSYRWVQLALRQLQQQTPSIPRANQALAMLNVAVYDSMVTVWQAKYTYNRPRPAQLAPDLAAIATPASPSYPDEHAAAAGAASAILSFLYPAQADAFAATAREAAQTRLLAGVAFPSDIEAGLSLGQAVAQRVIAYTVPDMDVAAWWDAPPPSEPLSPIWRPWTLSSAAEFLPAAPAVEKSDAAADDLLRLQQLPTVAGEKMRSQAVFWNSFAGTHVYWYDLAAEKMAQYHIDTNPVLAARIYALMSVAQDDAGNACWDALYTYRVLRPSRASADDAPRLTPLTPYSYPSVPACLASDMSTVLGAVFSLDAQAMRANGEEAAQAGLWVDGALPVDIQVGSALGRLVALHVLSHPLSWLWGGD